MGEADKHPHKDYEKLIRRMEQEHGWRRKRGRKKMKAICSCGRHRVLIALTPSSQRTLTNTEAALRRMQRTCEGEA